MTTTSRLAATTLAAILLTVLAPTTSHAGHFALAFQRKLSGWENNAKPGCPPQDLGGRAIRIWIWDENGYPVPNVKVQNRDNNQHFGYTTARGRLQLDFQSKNDFYLICIDSIGSTYEEAGPFIKELDPCRDRHSYEIGYLYKTNKDNPGSFDLDVHCTWPESDTYFTQAPYTKSLTYSGVDCTDYFSDDSLWGNWQYPPSYFGQTFVATADRIVAARTHGTIGGLDLLDWKLQIVTFPGLEPVGPVTSVPVDWPFGWEAYWGVHDNPVIPGETYMLKIWRDGGGMNAYRVLHDVYPHGEYYEGTTRFPGYDLNGHIVAMSYKPPSETGEMVVLLELDESSGTTAEDSSGNERHGTLYGDPLWQPSGGRLGGALQFDGIDDYISTIGFHGITRQKSRTVAAWVKTDLDTFGDIVAWGTEATGRRWSLVTGPMGGSFGIYVMGGFAFGQTKVCDGDWHHIAATLQNDDSTDVDDVTLYADGKLETAPLHSGQAVNTAADLYVTVGTFDDGTERYFEGLIDQVAIFDFALSDEQISRLYHIGARSFLEPCGGFNVAESYLLDGDISGNCEVNSTDLALLARLWLETGPLLPADIHKDESVDWLDVSVLAGSWTDTIPPPVK
ncbi:MAG: hypothetical protein ISS79_07895 [Phycisphaerae bacterium]|nr:hypothetical protein [Phycisphaerae bacterium]